MFSAFSGVAGLIFKKQPRALSRKEASDEWEARALQVYYHHRTADRAVARTIDFVGDLDSAPQDGREGSPIPPLERRASGNLCDDFDRKPWSERARLISHLTLQNYILLGQVDGYSSFLKANVGHTYVLGSTGDNKTSLGFAPTLSQYLWHRAIDPQSLTAYEQALADIVPGVVQKAFRYLLRNRLHTNLKWRCGAYEPFSYDRYFSADNGKHGGAGSNEVYRHEETFIWQNEHLVDAAVENLLPLLGAENSLSATHGTVPAVLETHLGSYLRAYIPSEDHGELWGKITRETAEDIRIVARARRSIEAKLCAAAVRAVTAAVLAGHDEVNFRHVVRMIVHQVCRDNPECKRWSGLTLGLQNLLADWISEEAWCLRQAATQLQGSEFKYAMIIIDMKGDNALFQTVRKTAEEEGRTFKFFTPALEKATFTYNPFDSIDYSRLSIENIAENLIHALGLPAKGETAFFTVQETRWLTRKLEAAYERGRPIRSIRELANLANDAVDSKEEAFIHHLCGKLSSLGRIQQLNVSSPDGINIQRAIKAKEVLYFRLSPIDGEQTAAMLAKIILEQVSHHGELEHPTLVFIDEFQKIISENVSGFLEQSRNIGVSLFLANQSIEPLDNGNILDTVWENTQVKYVFSGRSPATIRYLTEVSGTRFEIVPIQTESVTSSNTASNGSNSASSFSRGMTPTGETRSISYANGTDFSQAHMDGMGFSTQYRKDRVPFIDINQMLEINATSGAALLFVKGYDSAVVPKHIDLKHPFVVKMDHIMTKPEYDAMMATPWPSQIPGTQVFKQIPQRVSVAINELRQPRVSPPAQGLAPSVAEVEPVQTPVTLPNAAVPQPDPPAPAEKVADPQTGEEMVPGLPIAHASASGTKIDADCTAAEFTSARRPKRSRPARSATEPVDAASHQTPAPKLATTTTDTPVVVQTSSHANAGGGSAKRVASGVVEAAKTVDDTDVLDEAQDIHARLLNLKKARKMPPGRG